MIHHVTVLGTGKVGQLVGILLQEAGFTVQGVDQRPRNDLPYEVIAADVTNTEALKKAFAGQDAVVSCLPYALNIAVSDVAHACGIHYFDLTEDVPTTKHIRKLAETSKTVMAPQCGLAPGFIGIVGADLAKGFSKIRSIKLRVGALPQNPTGLMGYAFNWSPEGVVNEYLNDCEVIENGEYKWVSPLEWLETIHINGRKLEAFTTSGGLGTMCETYLGKAENIDYKTMRYPGHAALMNCFFHELLMREDRELAGRILTNAKPPVNDDIVYVHASVEGIKDGQNWREEFVRGYLPQMVGKTRWRAISWTTAASVTAVVEMVKNGDLPQKGFIKQEEIPFDKYLQTRTGRMFLQGDSLNATCQATRTAA